MIHIDTRHRHIIMWLQEVLTIIAGVGGEMVKGQEISWWGGGAKVLNEGSCRGQQNIW